MSSLKHLPLSLALMPTCLIAVEKPNIILFFADDISAREFPIYESDEWTAPDGSSTSDVRYRAQMPVVDRMAREGVWVETCWTATISSPSRAQMMTGRYAHLHKWWHNGDFGRYNDAAGREQQWPIFESSPSSIGVVAKQGGYATYWAGKTQMPRTEEIERYGFDEGCYTPGSLSNKSVYTDFTMSTLGEKRYLVKDSGREINTYLQTSYYWQPSVLLVNHPDYEQKIVTWPVSEEDRASYGVETYGPDVELDFIFDFMERKSEEGKPLFIYHTSHLGHDAYDFLHPDNPAHWPAAPRVEWDGEKYNRTEPKITGDKGDYNTHNSIAEAGIHSQINYIDYQIWRYTEQLEKMGEADNTIFIIVADNGTSRYGKASLNDQRGVLVPLIIYAPCLEMTKQGKQEILVNGADILPTIAQIAGVELPAGYEINGEGLVPYLTSDASEHRDWIYSYRSDKQFVRGKFVMRDGRGVWYDVTEPTRGDLAKFPKIEDWSGVSAQHRSERDALTEQIKAFDLYHSEYNAPNFREE